MANRWIARAVVTLVVFGIAAAAAGARTTVSPRVGDRYTRFVIHVPASAATGSYGQRLHHVSADVWTRTGPRCRQASGRWRTFAGRIVRTRHGLRLYRFTITPPRGGWCTGKLEVVVSGEEEADTTPAVCDNGPESGSSQCDGSDYPDETQTVNVVTVHPRVR